MKHLQYAIITENDTSAWHDETGILYHYPQRYLSFLKPGTRIIYYKGRIRDKKFHNSRLSDDPHYFGCAIMGKQYPDNNSQKHNYYSEIQEFYPFTKPIPFKIANEYIEKIPINRKNNYWRDAVRVISYKTYEKILQLSENNLVSDYNNDYQPAKMDSDFETRIEGKKILIYTTVYERNPKLRSEAIQKHGLTCMACGFNFEKVYGALGKDFIHVHHLKPLHQCKEQQVNSTTDLIVLCPNCHCMIHRKKNKVLTLEELRQIIKHIY